MFIDLEHENLSFKMSNTKAAVFDTEGSRLFMGTTKTLSEPQEGDEA